MMSRFKDALDSGKFVVTAEVGPPKGCNLEPLRHHIELLKDRVDAINVTDNQSSVLRYPSLGGAILIKEMGGEPILQMTCRDRNRLSLQADLFFAYSRGVTNVLCLTGDAVVVGDHKEAKGVFDLDSVQLLDAIATLSEGRDLAGNALDGVPHFCRGAIVTPEAKPLEPQLLKFEKKIEAGAEFIQTQAVYDMNNFRTFMDYARRFDVKILAGMVLLTSAGMAKFMNKNVPGIFVPQNLIDELAGAPKGKALETGINIAAKMIRTIKEEQLADGVHIMAIGKEETVPRILDLAGIT